jgi:hypothetical protein
VHRDAIIEQVLTDNTLLVGPNWIINAPDTEAVQLRMGGAFIPKNTAPRGS